MHEKMRAAIAAAIERPAEIIEAASKLGISVEDLVRIGIGQSPIASIAGEIIDRALEFWPCRASGAGLAALAKSWPARCSECNAVHDSADAFGVCGVCDARLCPDCLKAIPCPSCAHLADLTARDDAEIAHERACLAGDHRAFEHAARMRAQSAKEDAAALADAERAKE